MECFRNLGLCSIWFNWELLSVCRVHQSWYYFQEKKYIVEQELYYRNSRFFIIIFWASCPLISQLAMQKQKGLRNSAPSYNHENHATSPLMKYVAPCASGMRVNFAVVSEAWQNKKRLINLGIFFYNSFLLGRSWGKL